MNRVVVTRSWHGLCGMQVCAAADATDEEILEVCNRENPSGVSNGWAKVAREDFEQENTRPVPCGDDPERRHFIVVC